MDAYKPTPSLKRSYFDPCLIMRPQRGSTMGRVTSKRTGDPFDDIDIDFRGKSIKAKAAHPEISVGQLVNVFEYPAGVFWGTCLQPSWFMQPVEDLVKNKRPAQAAMTYLMRKNPKYWPALITIDKRGQDEGGDGGGTGGGIDPDAPETWRDFDSVDSDGDGIISRDEWGAAGLPPDLFDRWDLNGDGVIDEDEWYQRGYAFPFDPAAYNNSWFFYIEHETGNTFPGTFVLQVSNGVRKSNIAGTYLSGITPANQAPYFGYPTITPSDLVQDLGTGKSRTFFFGVVGGSNTATLEAVTFHWSGGAGSTTDPADPAYVDAKTAAIAESIARASIINSSRPVFTARNRGEYAAYPVVMYSTYELGANFLAEEYVAYSSSARFTF